MIPKQYLGAFKAGHVPACRPFIDEDLSWKLLEKVMEYACGESRVLLEYITKFNNEYYKAVIKKGDEDAFHSNDDQRREISRIKYARRMDALSRYDLVYLHPSQKKYRDFNT